MFNRCTDLNFAKTEYKGVFSQNQTNSTITPAAVSSNNQTNSTGTPAATGTPAVKGV